jgi:nucleoside phosphorylase
VALAADHEVPPNTGYFTPAADPCDVVLWQSGGRGNVPAASAAADLLEDFRPEVLAVVGIAGGIADRGVRPGDVVVGEYIHYSEYVKVVPAGTLRRFAVYDQPSVSLRQRHAETVLNLDNWQQRIQVEPPVEIDPRAVVGSIVSGEKVLGDPKAEAQHYVSTTYDDALAVDMESFGTARAVHDARRDVDYSPRLLVIRGISDTVDVAAGDDEADDAEDNNAERFRWKPFAAASAAAFAAAVVERIQATDDPRAETRAAERG